MEIQRLLSLSRRSSTLSLSSDALRSFSATSSAVPTANTTSTSLPSPPRPDAMIYDRLASSINQKLKQLDSPDPRFLKEGEHAKESALALQNLLFLNRSSSSAIRSGVHFCGVGTSLWKSTLLPPLMPPSTQLFHTRPGLPSSTPSGSSGNSKRFLKYLEYSTKQGEHVKESALALQNLLFLNRSSSSAIRSGVNFCGVGTSLWKSTLLPPLMPPSTQLFHTRPGLPSSTPSGSSGNSKIFLKYLEYSTKQGVHAKESTLALQNLLFLNRSSSSAIRSGVHFCGVGTSLWKSTLLPPLMPPSTQLFHTRPGLPSSTPSGSSGNSKRFLKYLEYSTKQGAHAKDVDGGGKTLNKAILMARLVRGVFYHIHDGIKEIITDYVHHEMTRNVILVCLNLFYIIVLKDFFLFLFF